MKHETKHLERFIEVCNNIDINLMFYDFKNENSEFRDRYKSNNYIERAFISNESKHVDRDRCLLARGFYESFFKDIDASNPNYANKHMYSYDTINSFKTSYIQSFKIHCPKTYEEFYVQSKEKRKKMSFKWLGENIEKLYNTEEYQEFIEIEYINQLAYWTHTIGNFTLVPFYYMTDNGYIRPVNSQRGISLEIKDYFDLSVGMIKNGFEFCNKVYNNENCSNFQIDYVNRFYLNDYIKQDNQKIIPLLFFENHDKNALPLCQKEMKKCILEMIIRIIKRAKRILDAMDSNYIAVRMQVMTIDEVLYDYSYCLKQESCSTCEKKCKIKETFNKILSEVTY